MKRGSREKAFRMFSQVTRETTPFLKSVQLFRPQLERSKEEERLRCVGTLLKLGGIKLWNSGSWLYGSANGLWLANRRPPRKGHFRPPQKYYKLTGGRLKLFHLLQGRSKEE